MVNGILTKIGAMEDNFISVVPDSHKRGANPANVNAVRLSLQRLKEGHPMGFFPLERSSFYNKKEKQVRDLSWAHSVIRLVRQGESTGISRLFNFRKYPFLLLVREYQLANTYFTYSCRSFQ